MTKADLLIFDVGYWKGCANQMRDRAKASLVEGITHGLFLFLASAMWSALSFPPAFGLFIGFFGVSMGFHLVHWHVFKTLAKTWDAKSDDAVREHAELVVSSMLAWRRREVSKGMAS